LKKRISWVIVGTGAALSRLWWFSFLLDTDVPETFCVRYVFCCSHSHNVAPKGKYIAFVSAEVETENPESELEPGLALLGHIDEKIIDMYDMYEPVNDSSLDSCFISKVPKLFKAFIYYIIVMKYCTAQSYGLFLYHFSIEITTYLTYFIYIILMAFVTVRQSYDPTTHFETTVQDVLSMYTRITGKVSLFPQSLKAMGRGVVDNYSCWCFPLLYRYFFGLLRVLLF
jgi:hypothetical protein